MTKISAKECDSITPDKGLRSWFRWSGVVTSVIGSAITMIVAGTGWYYTVGHGITKNHDATIENAASIKEHDTRIKKVEDWQTARDGSLGFNAQDGQMLRAEMIAGDTYVKDEIKKEIAEFRKEQSAENARIRSQLAATVAILERLERKIDR